MSRRLQAGQAQANKKARTGNGPQKKGAPMQTRRQFIKTLGVAKSEDAASDAGNLEVVVYGLDSRNGPSKISRVSK